MLILRTAIACCLKKNILIVKMSCCPKNAEGFLASTYATVGWKESIPGCEFYASGSQSSKKSIIMVPDVWGWDSGRIRALADFCAEKGYFTVIPKLSTPPLEGGTDGDALPADFNVGERRADFVEYFTGITWEEKLKPKISAVTNHLKAQGVETISTIGFCWGGWVVSKILADTDLSQSFICGGSPHPSVQLEQMLFGRGVVELLSEVKKPMIFFPAMGDGEGYNADGEWFGALLTKNPTSVTTSDEFRQFNHGFVPRGPDEPAVKEAIVKLFDKYFAFVASHT